MANNIVFIECTRHYPFKYSADNSKIELIARGLVEQGDRVTIINSVAGEKDLEKEALSGEKEGIRYVSFVDGERSIQLILLNLFRLGKELKKIKSSDTNIVVLLSPIYCLFLTYVFYARLFGYKIAIIIHEWHIAWQHKGLVKLSDYLFDKTFGFFADVILPISHFLEAKVEHFNRPTLLVPILAEYSDEHVLASPRNYFLYCGSVGYYRLIFVIIDAFNLFLNEGYNYNLLLVLSGDEGNLKRIINHIEKKRLTLQVKIIQNLSKAELHRQMANSIALLIPLSENSIADQARFSQKIAEYLSSRRPLITVNVGEIQYYFKDCYNAYVASSFTVTSIAEKMKGVVSNLEMANWIGQNGFELGKAKFNYKRHGQLLHDFFAQYLGKN